MCLCNMNEAIVIAKFIIFNCTQRYLFVFKNTLITPLHRPLSMLAWNSNRSDTPFPFIISATQTYKTTDLSKDYPVSRDDTETPKSKMHCE